MSLHPSLEFNNKKADDNHLFLHYIQNITAMNLDSIFAVTYLNNSADPYPFSRFSLRYHWSAST